MGDNIPNYGEHQQLTLASFFTVKGTGSRFSQPVSKKNKRGRIETEVNGGHGSGSRCGSGGRCNIIVSAINYLSIE